MKAQNRRYIVRWHLNKEGRVKLGDGADFVPCQLKDINLKGCQIALEEKLEKDSSLKLTLDCGAELTLTIEVWVAWHRAAEGRNLYGLYFSKIKDSDKEIIYKYIQKYCSKDIIQHQWKEAGEGGERMQNAEFEDRRIFARFPARLALRFLCPSLNRECLAQTVDVSAKGIGLETSEELSPDMPLELWLKVPDGGEPLYARGAVAWSEKAGHNQYKAGIELEKANFMGMSRILRTV